MFRVALPVLILACVVLVACTKSEAPVDEPSAAESQYGLASVQKLVEQMVQERELDPEPLYLVTYSSDPVDGGKFVPIAVPITDEIAKLVLEPVEYAEIGGNRFAFWDLYLQEYDPRKAFHPSFYAVIIGIRNDADFPRSHYATLFDKESIEVAIDWKTESYPYSAMGTEDDPFFEWEVNPISAGAGSGRYLYYHGFRTRNDPPMPSEELFGYIEYEDYTVGLVHLGPLHKRTQGRAQETKRQLLNALQGVIRLESGGSGE